MNKAILFSVFSLFFVSSLCAQDLPQMYNLKEILNQKRTNLYLEDYAHDFEFISLETIKESLIGIPVQVQIFNTRIFVRDHANRVFIFDRKGNFISKLTPMGKGPGEFLHVQQGFVFFEERGRICVYDDMQRKVLLFDSDGRFIHEKRLDYSVEAICDLNQNTLLLFSDSRYNKGNPHSVSYFDLSTLQIVDQVEVVAQFQAKEALIYVNPGISSNNGQGLLRIPFCDTIFKITVDDCFPYIGFNLGSYKIPKTLFTNLDKLKSQSSNYSEFSLPHEMENYLMFRVRDRGRHLFVIYNKLTDVWKVSNYQANGKAGLTFSKDNPTIIDFNGCKNECFFSIIEATDFIKNYQKEYPQSTAELEEEDNPIVFIARLK